MSTELHFDPDNFPPELLPFAELRDGFLCYVRQDVLIEVPEGFAGATLIHVILTQDVNSDLGEGIVKQGGATATVKVATCKIHETTIIVGVPDLDQANALLRDVVAGTVDFTTTIRPRPEETGASTAAGRLAEYLGWVEHDTQKAAALLGEGLRRLFGK